MAAYIYNMADTWNTGATTFTAIKMNVTDTASAAGSLLMDLQVGGSSKYAIFKNGGIANGGIRFGNADAATAVAQTLSVQSVVAGTTNTAGANFTITGSQGTGTGAGGSIVFQVAPAGSSGSAQNALATALTINADRTTRFENSIVIGRNTGGETFNVANEMIMGAGAGINLTLGSIGFSGSFGAIQDVRLYRDAANTLALRNGTNAQTFRVYSTFTDASNYERGALNAGADFIELAAETAGTGDDNLDVRLTPAGTGNVRFGTHTATSDTAVSGYIEIKDSGGTIRKLAVIS